MLTSFGELSRNRAAGVRLAQGETVEEVSDSMTVEGFQTSKVAVRYAELYGLELPIFRMIADMVAGDVEIQDAGLQLLGKYSIK